MGNILVSIFFDEKIQSIHDTEIFAPQDLTKHYRQEIQDMAIDRILVASHYDTIHRALEAYKYHSDRHYSPLFVDLLSKLLEQYRDILQSDSVGIIGVPMHWSRYIFRGFHHIDRIGVGFAKKQNIPILRPLVARMSRRQSRLSKRDRKRNRERAYFLRPTQQDLPREIILVDDVISTGSTANACASLLKECGVEKVYGLFLASNQ